ncbi:hypothetical protein D3C73_977180 [compost metagenome]
MMGQRNLLISGARIQHPHPDLGRHKIRSADRLAPVQRSMQPDRLAACIDHTLRQFTYNPQLLCTVLDVGQIQLSYRKYLMITDQPFNQLRRIGGTSSNYSQLQVCLLHLWFPPSLLKFSSISSVTGMSK